MGLSAILAVAAALSAFSTTPAEARRHHYVEPRSLTDPAKDAALIVDGETGKVLYSRNATAERHPASLTKLMTLYLLFDALKTGQVKLDTVLPISSHAASQKPTNLHLTAGDTITVEKAIKAVVVRSANDVAVAIAEALGGTESHFAEMMNARARALGMRDTFYHNASGLPDPLQITTASDLAILARHLAYDFPQYFHYFATEQFNYHGANYEGHDNLLGRYEGTDGMKTGYTRASGFNLVSSVVRDNAHVIGVVMGGRTAHKRDKEMMRLLDKTFASIEQDHTMVAHAQVPWKTVAQNATVPQPFAFSMPGVRGPVTDTDDEDTAESRSDEDYDNSAETAAPAVPVAPAPPPKPVVVAAYQPKPIQTPRRVVARNVGEGDTGDPVTPTPSLGMHDWTIQIGAFTDLKVARAQLAAYAEKSMDILGQAQRIVVPFQSIDGQLLYRARFGPFVEREARQVCARLTERGQTCFAAIATR